MQEQRKTYRNKIGEHSTGRALQLGIVLLGRGLAFQIVLQEIIQHRECEECLYVLEGSRKESTSEKLFILVILVGANTEDHLYFEDSTPINDS
jgi:hypothetical protein